MLHLTLLPIRKLTQALVRKSAPSRCYLNQHPGTPCDSSIPLKFHTAPNPSKLFHLKRAPHTPSVCRSHSVNVDALGSEALWSPTRPGEAQGSNTRNMSLIDNFHSNHGQWHENVFVRLVFPLWKINLEAPSPQTLPTEKENHDPKILGESFHSVRLGWMLVSEPHSRALSSVSLPITP